MKKIFTLLLAMLVNMSLFSQAVYYVKTSGNDANSGLSWGSAFKTLQKALSIITSGQVWVAAGTYYPDEMGSTNTNDRNASFFLKNAVSLYGGFAGNETQLSQRNLKTYITKLSGDIDKNGNLSNNAYHVVRSNYVNNTAILDGFTITGGNADEYYVGDGRFGGGMFNYSSSPIIANCIFSGNSVNLYGGGVYNGTGTHIRSVSPVFINCSFSGNVADSGGGIFNEGYVEESGAYYVRPSLINCTFFGNQAISGGAISNFDWSEVNLTNCILWGNSESQIFNDDLARASVTFSIIQGGYAGAGNLNSDPLFVNATAGDLHLQYCSPAIEAGTNAAITVATDLDGLPRIANNKVDMGAYESQLSRIRYVKANATGSNNGTSWVNAFTKLQDALKFGANCQSPIEIWVAAGTHYPDEGAGLTNNDRTASFTLANHMAVYGGFKGTETELNQRNQTTTLCILSGDIDQAAGNTGNSFHVLKSTSVNNTAVLDGFIITGGNANGSDTQGKGGGMYIEFASPTVNNCSFSQNNAAAYGGAMYNDNSTPVITGCQFIENTSGNEGGGIYNTYSSPNITNSSFTSNSAQYSGGGMANEHYASPEITSCSFFQNHANAGGGIYNFSYSSPVIAQSRFGLNTARLDGGGVYNYSSFPRFINCIFWKNTGYAGGGMENFYANPTLVNCSFSQNTGTHEGGGINNSYSTPTITNCILWGNSGNQIFGGGSVNYSIVQGGYSGSSNMNADPMFVAASNGILKLSGCSPAINTGTATGAPSTDMEGNPRPLLGGYDIGAYEFHVGGEGTILYVNHNAPAGGDGASWARAFKYLQDALVKAQTCYSPTQIWVSAGTYYPDEGAGLTNNDRNSSFNLKNNTVVYGGFNGTEISIYERDWKNNPTILSGDIDQVTGNQGNAYHVVRIECIDTTSTLDGFTITGGNANDPLISENCRGGGIYISGSPRISHCIIRSNHADFYGGGIVNNTSAIPVITNCIFWGNSASAGGGLSNYNYSPATIRHCSFSANTAANGGAIYNINSTPTIINSILWGNSASQIGNASGSANVTYSIIQDGYYPGTGNLNTDPLFINSSTGDLHLQACSPAIDAGNKTIVTAVTDLDGAQRIVINQTDMGAYEFQGTIIYVKPNSTGGNNGTSWANAFTYLQDALAVPTGCSRLPMIWVAQGTYYPDEGTGYINNNRNASFIMRNNLAILGGFQGTETSLAQRIPVSARYYKTILSGEIDGVTGNAGNSYHVVRSGGTNSSSTLDGFTITGGNANGSAASNNQGGGLYNNGSPIVSYCTFIGNTATNGGAVYNSGSCSLINNIFIQNKAGYGGGIFNSSASPSILNAIFWQNNGISQGGAIYNTASSPAIINGSFYGNTSPYGEAIRNMASSAPAITNCILWGNNSQISNSSSTPVVTYSIVQGGYSGIGNVNADPLFSGPATGNLVLQYGSPAIDAGNNAAVTLSTDNDGDQRIYNNIVDMGANEFYPGGKGGPEPLAIHCPGDFVIQTVPGSCGAIADFSGPHAAIASGGEPPIIITYEPAAGTLLTLGDTWITAIATDSVGHSCSCNFWITVADSTAPVITDLAASPSVLYPPNHQMQDIVLGYTASDNCSTEDTTSVSVSSNEAVNMPGSGNTGADWQVIDNHHIKLMAERSGSGTDRVYTITITATDAAGNTRSATTTVTVPHDKASVTRNARLAVSKEIAGLHVSAAPNPFTNGFNLSVQSTSSKLLSIRVLDVEGKLIESRSGVSSKAVEYLGETYRPGVYYVQVMQGDEVQSIKLVKQ